MLSSVTTVLVARGRRLEEYTAGDVAPSDLLGPTGKFRAPMVAIGEVLLVGFNSDALERLLAAG